MWNEFTFIDFGIKEDCSDSIGIVTFQSDVLEFHDVIIAIYGGHHQTDQFKLIYDKGIQISKHSLRVQLVYSTT